MKISEFLNALAYDESRINLIYVYVNNVWVQTITADEWRTHNYKGYDESIITTFYIHDYSMTIKLK